MLHLFYITHEGGEWLVHAESGKVLGRHKTKKDAEAQLRAIEAHKHMSFYSKPLEFADVRTGVWDRMTSWGVKVKDGEQVEFNEQTLGQIVNNFASRENLVSMDEDHKTAYVATSGEGAPALAFYCALCVVKDGRVVSFATRDDSVLPPFAADKADGLYGYRSEVTPLGQDKLPNYKYISPMFTSNGADEQGQEIGYDLINVAATNTPFQDGCQITFTKEIVMVKKEADIDAMKKEFDACMAEVGELKEKYGAALEDMRAKMASHEESMAKFKAMTEDAPKDEEKLAEEPKAEEKLAEEPKDEEKLDAGAGGQDPKSDEKPEKMADQKDEEDKKAMAAMCKDLGVESIGVKAYASFAAKYVSAEKLAAAEGRIAELEGKLKTDAEVQAEKAAEALVDQAVKLGKLPEDAEKRPTFLKLAKGDAKDFEAVCMKPGTYTVLKRFTRAGEPEGIEKKDPENFYGEAKNDLEIGSDTAKKAHELAKKEGISYGVALSKLAMARK